MEVDIIISYFNKLSSPSLFEFTLLFGKEEELLSFHSHHIGIITILWRGRGWHTFDGKMRTSIINYTKLTKSHIPAEEGVAEC